MLYIKGKINSVAYKEPEGKKPFYNVQFSDENENGSIFTTWCKIYTDTVIPPFITEVKSRGYAANASF